VIAWERHGDGPRLALQGPGIKTIREMSVGVPRAFWDLRRDLCSFPDGFELLLIVGDAVIGIPRSTRVEVL